MRITLTGDSIPDEFLRSPVRSRVKMEITFEVEGVREESEFDPGSFHLSGDVREFEVKEIRGVGGLDPTVEAAHETLRKMSGRMPFRTSGTMG